MQRDGGRINYGVTLDNSQLRVDAQESKRLLQGIGTQAKKEGDDIDASMKKIGQAMAGVFAVSQLKDFVKQVATVRGEFQQLEIAFSTMLGSKAESDKLMSQLIQTAVITPFGMNEVANGAKQLLAYGLEADKVNETLIRLGDIAAGLSIPINDLAYLYGTTMVQGRMYTQDLNQFLGRGIPLTEELAKQFGVTSAKVKDLVTEGKVGFPEVEKAIISMTSEGGKFGGLMEAQSKSITGQISNLEDAIEQMFNELGKQSEGVIADTLDGVSKVIDNWQTIGKVLLTVVAAYGTYKAAVLAVAAAHKLAAVWGEVQAFLSLTKSVTSAKDAMLLLNMATKANPIGLILGVVAAAAAAFGLFSENTSKAAQMTNKYGDSAASTIMRVQTLSTELNGLTSGSSTHKKVMEELNKILEDYGVTQITEKDNIEEVNKKREQAIELIKREAAERQRANALEQGYNDYMQAIADAQAALSKGLQGAETGSSFMGLIWSTDNEELQQNASAITTIIGQQVQENISLIAGKTGKEYEDGLNKIYAQIQDRMRAIGISEETIAQAWWDDGFFVKTNVVQKYINDVQAAKEANDRYNESVNTVADAEQNAADKTMDFSDRVAATQRSLTNASDDVHTLYRNIKNLMSKYSQNTIGFNIVFSGSVPKWMKTISNKEVQRLATYFSSLGDTLAKDKKTGAFVNGKWMTTQEILQRGADYSTEAENRQQAADQKARDAETAKKNKKNKTTGKTDKQRAEERAEEERKRIAEETAQRSITIAEYGQKVAEQVATTELDIRQKQIEAMEEGYEKQKAQLDLNYDRLIEENQNREQQMLSALADKKVLEWQNEHPKAKNSEVAAYRQTLLSADSQTRLTRSDLSQEQQQQLQAYDNIANESRIRGNKEALKTMLADCQTYEQQRAEKVEEYQKKIEALYEHDASGNRVKDVNGKDTFKDGFSQENVAELQYQQEQALSAIDQQFAQREETYKAWCSEIANLSLEQLNNLLTQAQQELADMEAKAKKGTASQQQLAVARAKVSTAQQKVSSAKAKADLNPGKRSVKEWEDLYKTLNECEKSFEGIGDAVGGTVGDIISAAGSIASSTLTMINGIVQLANMSSMAMQSTAKSASTAIQTVEKASVILTIISAALQIAMTIANLFNDDEAKQEQIEHLQDRIDQLQWELDNADIVRLQETSGRAIEHVRDALTETRLELIKNREGVNGLAGAWTAMFTKVSNDTELMEGAAQRLVAAYANMAYTANKYLGEGNTKYDQAEAQLQNYAQQMLLIQEQIATEQSKKDSDDGAIADYEQKLEELGAEMENLLNELVEDIIGGSSSDIAEELSDAFFEAFQNGEDYAEAWGDKVNEIIADIMKRMLVQKFLEEPLGQIFDKYKAQWFDSKTGKFAGVDAVISSLSGLESDLTEVGSNWTEIWETLPQSVKDLIGEAGEATREASSKGIAEASQDSVDELNGRMTAVQGHTYSINENTKLLVTNTNLILRSVQNIDRNTEDLPERLSAMQGDIKELRSTVNDIVLKGIKIK